MSRYGAPGSFIANPSAAAVPAVTPAPTQIQRIGDSALWSTWDFGPTTTALASTQKDYFAAKIGDIAQGYTRSMVYGDTNMQEGGRIPTLFSYNVIGIAVIPHVAYPSGAAATAPVPSSDLLNIQNQSALRWDLFGTTIDICPTSLAGAGGGVFGATADTGLSYGGPATAGSAVALNNGNGQVWVYRAQSIMMPAGQTFRLSQLFTPDAAVVDLDSQATYRLRCRVSLLGGFAQGVAVG